MASPMLVGRLHSETLLAKSPDQVTLEQEASTWWKRGKRLLKSLSSCSSSVSPEPCARLRLRYKLASCCSRSRRRRSCSSQSLTSA